MTEKTKILIVEDDPLAGKALVSILTIKGYQADYVSNGTAALEILREQEFRAILLDIQMPDLDGAEVARTLRGFMGIKTPIIAVTALRMNYGLLGELGINGCINKPFRINELFEEIKRVTATQQIGRT